VSGEIVTIKVHQFYLSNSELNALNAELIGLTQMLSSLQSRAASQQSQYSRQSTRNTAHGIVSLLGRHVFALYCIYRILAAGWSCVRLLVGKHRVTADDDPISRVLAFLSRGWISAGNGTLDIEGWRRVIGFILVGVVIAGSINAVVSTVQRVSPSNFPNVGFQIDPISCYFDSVYIAFVRDVFCLDGVDVAV
jgi:Abscisic acid G-protein coupled receptor